MNSGVLLVEYLLVTATGEIGAKADVFDARSTIATRAAKLIIERELYTIMVVMRVMVSTSKRRVAWTER